MTRILRHLDWAAYGQLVDELTRQVAVKHAEDAFTDIIGIARGGLIPLAAICNQPSLANLHRHIFTVSHYRGQERKNKAVFVTGPPNIFRNGYPRVMNVLVVDDVLDSGNTIQIVQNAITLYHRTLRNAPEVRLTYATLLVSTRHSARTDVIAAESIADDEWAVFPYET